MLQVMYRAGPFILGASVAVAVSAVVPIVIVVLRRGSGGAELVVISFLAIVPSVIAAKIGALTRPAHVVRAAGEAGAVASVLGYLTVAVLGGGYGWAFGPMSGFAVIGWTVGAIVGAVAACRARPTPPATAVALVAAMLALIGPAAWLTLRKPEYLRVKLRNPQAAREFAEGVVPHGYMLSGMNELSFCGEACYVVGFRSDAPASDVEAATAFISSFPGVVDVTTVDSSG